jgi:hypothetical protein
MYVIKQERTNEINEYFSRLIKNLKKFNNNEQVFHQEKKKFFFFFGIKCQKKKKISKDSQD